MPLPSPNLDDRGFRDLLRDAIHQMDQSCSSWTDRSPSDPGMVLLELFAHLTEVMNFRLNRVPEKAYIEFLRLLDVRLDPPIAAAVSLTFSLARSQESDVEIPEGTKITSSRSRRDSLPPIFITRRSNKISAGKTSVDVNAFHCEQVTAEAVGEGSGLPGLIVVLKKSPVIARSGQGNENDKDLLVVIEAEVGELDERIPAIKHEGKTYIIWKEVKNFSNLEGSKSRVYMVDRIGGTITFSPSVSGFNNSHFTFEAGSKDNNEFSNESAQKPKALAAVPGRGKKILVWYTVGGGEAGNVGENTLVTLKSPLAGIKVNNKKRAFGGKNVESLDNAMIRGPLEFNTLQRAVTAKDFELLAVSCSGAVARAKAFTARDLWMHAAHGSATVLLVPDMPKELSVDGRVKIGEIKKQEEAIDIQSIRNEINERRPIGTHYSAEWASYKEVQIQARVVVHREEDRNTLEKRVLSRIYNSISPIPLENKSFGWEFGRALHVSHVYDIILSEPGISYVDNVKLLVKNVPDSNVRVIAADKFQPDTWYAATQKSALFRSMDNGSGWERVGYFPGEKVNLVNCHSSVPGLISVVSSEDSDSNKCHVYISRTCGENWRFVAHVDFEINDMAWISRDDNPILLIATDVGLYELNINREKTSPVQILVDPKQQDLGFYAIEVIKNNFGVDHVAVAARSSKGVFFSNDNAQPNSFKNIGLINKDVRVLSVQYEGPRIFLWAGLAAPSPNSKGEGCMSCEITQGIGLTIHWNVYENWEGGSCNGIAFIESIVYVATFRSGVLSLDSTKRDSKWVIPDIESNVPLRDIGRFEKIRTIATGIKSQTIMVGGDLGVYVDYNDNEKFNKCSNKEFSDTVTLPPTWLFCSGEHNIVVVKDA